jgi:hypothetical protein
MLAASIGHATDNIQAIREKALLELQSNHRSAEIGLGKHFLARFEQHYAGYKINSYCDGSFKNEGESEYLLGIVNPTNGEGEYLVLFGDANIRIAKFTLAPTWQESLPDVKCFSEMGAKRRNATIKHSESISGQIAPVNHFDVACVAPYNTHSAFTCYTYSAKQNGFLGIGGWSN